MSVIHCHDDNNVVIMDQNRLLSHTYTSTKDWRNLKEPDRRRNLTWRKNLFYVERPFRMANTAEMKKKKKKSTV